MNKSNDYLNDDFIEYEHSMFIEHTDNNHNKCEYVLNWEKLRNR